MQDRQSITPTDNPSENSPMHSEQFLAELEKSGRQLITFTDIPQDLSQELTSLVEDLDELKEYVSKQESTISQKNASIEDKVTSLRKHKLFPESADVRHIFKQTALDYNNLIENAHKEISSQLEYYQKYLEKKPQHLIAPKAHNEQEDSLIQSYFIFNKVMNDIKGLKKYLRKRKKEFAVFFSRYEHGYRVHMQRLSLLEYRLKMAPSQ